MEQVFTPFREALNALSRSIFGVNLSGLPDWAFELAALEAEHSASGLRGRARRRLASLRARDRQWWRLQARRDQRLAIGIRDV